MVENEENKETPEDTKPNNEEDSKPDNSNSEISPIEEAKALNKENKELFEKISEERKKIEKAAGEMLMSGRSLAGGKEKEKTEDEIYLEQANERYNGLGISPIPKKGSF